MDNRLIVGVSAALNSDVDVMYRHSGAHHQ